LGLFFPRDRVRDLERGIRSAARELGFEDGEACVEWLLSAPLERSHIEALAGHLTVGETYFFRDRKIFQALEEAILPELIQERCKNGGHVKIWSAGCSTGEEPYSIAMLLVFAQGRRRALWALVVSWHGALDQERVFQEER